MHDHTRIRFDTAASATLFAGTIAPLGFVVAQFDRELSISVSSDVTHAPLSAEALSACPTHQALVAMLASRAADSGAPHAAHVVPRGVLQRGLLGYLPGVRR